MRLAVLAALAAAFLLPAAAQTSAPRGDPRPATKAAQAPAQAQATATPRERARLAKAQNRDSRCLAKQKDRQQKKATAT